MNSTFKKALCLSLILSLSAPISAGWWDTAKSWLTPRNIAIAGVTIAAVAFYLWPKTVDMILIDFNFYSVEELGIVAKSKTLECRIVKEGNCVKIIENNTGRTVLRMVKGTEILFAVGPHKLTSPNDAIKANDLVKRMSALLQK